MRVVACEFACAAVKDAQKQLARNVFDRFFSKTIVDMAFSGLFNASLVFLDSVFD